MSKEFVSSLIGLTVYAASIFVSGHFLEENDNAFYLGFLAASIVYPISKGVEKGVNAALRKDAEIN
jgi:hypothetical protein